MGRFTWVMCVLVLFACDAGVGEPCGEEVGGELGMACEPHLYCEGDFDEATEDSDTTCGPFRVFVKQGVCVEAKAPGEPCEGFWNECRDGECVSGRCEAAPMGGSGWGLRHPDVEHVPADRCGA